MAETRSTQTRFEIDLGSDTKTRPTPAMRQAIAEAEVGDEQSGEDPTVDLLCDRMAELMGHERAVFLPSGTMANEIAMLVHCRPGDEVLADRTAHILTSEGGAPAALAGVQITPLDGDRGVFTADAVAAAIREKSRYVPETRLVSIEQTSNFGGGTIWPLATVRAVADVAHAHGLAVHMDGARLMNAVVASGVQARAYASPCDSAWLDFSKGLGCPFGAVLSGSASFIDRAWRWKQRMGGAMRQAGMMAAAALYALDHHVERLAEDHRAAAVLAEGLARIPGIRVDPGPTNIVFFDVAETGIAPADFAARLAARGIRVSQFGNRLRAVTHLDIPFAAIATVLDAAREATLERAA